MKLAVVLAVAGALAVCGAGIVFYGASRWQAGTDEFRARMRAARTPISPVTYGPQELGGLPQPVQRYFRAVLQGGAPIVAGARISQTGEFRLGEAGENWRPFAATQIVTTRPPGFDWDARIRMAPGVNVFVRDAYATGDGILHAEVLGLFTVADLRGTPEAAQGELMRYLAEAPWYPTALLPSQGVRWEPVDGSRARAILTDRGVGVALEFEFDGEGLVAVVRSPSRYRTVGSELQLTPWEGRFTAYTRVGGMRVPLEGEVAWLLPSGRLPYWRGRITEIDYELAR